MYQFLKYFPSNWNKWKKYIGTSLPAILAAVIFSLNAFVDNFMSTNLEGGNQALSYANTWTELQIGIIGLTSVVGSIIFAQYLGKQDFKKVKEVINARILLAVGISLVFIIPSIITPNNMIRLISGFDNNLLPIVLDKASLYIRIITISWFLNAIWYVVSMILREKHHANVSFISSVISLVVNIVLNSIFIYVLKFDIEYLAWTTVISNILGLSYEIIYIYVKEKEIAINPLKIFIISKEILKQFIQRSTSFVLFTIGSIAINIRFIIWNIGYPTGSIGSPLYVLSAANILGITGMVFNIFWTAFESVGANVAIYVGKELGNNRFETARRNALELQGFHTIVAIILAILLFGFSFAMQQMTIFSDGYKQSLVSYLQANNYSQQEIDTITHDAINLFMSDLKYTLWPLSLFMPMFIWFITRERTISSGGFTNAVGWVESLTSVFQLAWLALVCFVFNQENKLSFPMANFIFYLSDIPKFIAYEILNYKIDWARNITNSSYSIN